MPGAMRYHAPALDTESTWKKLPQLNCAMSDLTCILLPRLWARRCGDGLTHQPIIDGNQKKRYPTRISGKRLSRERERARARPVFTREVLFLFGKIFIRVRASISRVGKYYNDSLTVKISHDTPR